MGVSCGVIGERSPPKHSSATLVDSRPDPASALASGGAAPRLSAIDLEPGGRRRIEREPGPVRIPELLAA